jgi:hypothetical protein
VHRLLSLVLLVALSEAEAAEGETGTLGLTWVTSRDARLIYPSPMLDYLEPHVLRTFTNSLAWQKRIFNWVPYERTTVFLKDFSDYGNGSASVAPINLLALDIAPLSLAFETFPASERMYTLMNHELVHVATMDMSTGYDRGWRFFFGGKLLAQSRHPETILYSYLTVPRFYVPRWYLEGSATFLDTWMGGGLGRAQGGYDEMVFRAMVRDKAPFYDPLGLASLGVKIDFQVGVNAYLYGTRFFTYLALVHSPEKVVAWLKRDEGSDAYYSAQFQHVFGLSLDQAWAEWIAFEHEFQERNLAEIRRQPITPYRDLVPRALGSVSRAFFEESTGLLYGGFRYPGVVEHVGALDIRTGEVRRLVDIKGAMLYRVTSLAWDPDTRTLFYTSDNYALRDVMALDAATGQERMLLEDARIGELVFDRKDRSLLGVRHANGLATLVRIPYPYKEWKQVHTFPYGVVPYDLDISPDGRLLSASCSEVNGDQYLRVWEIEKLGLDEATPLSEFRFGQSVPEGFVFTPDGRSLYGSSYYTGVSNIFRYDVGTAKIEAVSNAELGFFRPAPLPDGKLLVFRYSGQGFVPAVIEPKVLEDLSAIHFLGTEVATKHPVVTTWQVPPPSTANPEAIAVTGRGPYNPLGELGLRGIFPVVEGYKDSVALGWHAEFEDPIHLISLGLTAAFSLGDVPGVERPHLMLDWRYLGWHGDVSWNRSDFYDLFGPTKRSRKGFATHVGYDHSFIYDLPRRLELKSVVAFFDGIDTLPNAQNIPAPVGRLFAGEVGLHYSYLRRSLGAVDDEKGIAWELVFSATQVHGDFIPAGRGGLDLGFALPVPHMSLWFRGAAGISAGALGDPFATFYFGGFGNNYVDDHPVQQYLEWYSFPGFALDALDGRSFGRLLTELKLPPVIFERVGTPAFYLNWLRPEMFAALLVTDPERASLRGTDASVGAQIDLRFSVLHWYEMTLSAGFAVGVREWQQVSHEWMVSLKVL